MENAISYLLQKYRPLTVLVYGSFADNTNNAHSDFDALVIAEGGAQCHDDARVDGTTLDVYRYPASFFAGAWRPDAFPQLLDARVALDTDGRGAAILERVRAYYAALPSKPAREVADSIAWCRKMCLRAARGDAEGLFRWHWMLTDSLEIYSDARAWLYRGPKKTLIRMREGCPDDYARCADALARPDAAGAWIDCIERALRSRAGGDELPLEGSPK